MALTITNENLVLDLVRKEGERLRLTAVKAITDEGREVTWHTLDLGHLTTEKFVSKTRLTIRGTELQPIFEAMQLAIYGRRIPPGAIFPEFEGSSSNVEPEPETPY